MEFSRAMTKIADIIHTAKSCIKDAHGGIHEFNAQDWEAIGVKVYISLENAYHLDGDVLPKMRKLIDDVSQKIAPELAKYEIAEVLRELPILVHDMHDAAEGIYKDIIEVRNEFEGKKTEMILDIVEELVKQFCNAVHSHNVHSSL